LHKLGFHQSEHEHAVYCRQSRGGGRLIIGVYVDDLVITGTTPDEIAGFKEEMKMQFKMADLGLLSFYLGLEVEQGPVGIKLCQSHYVVKILEAAGMAECNSAQMPMEERLKLSWNSETEEDATLYRKLIGSLRYLVHTRPDLIFVVGYLGRFMQWPTTQHMATLKRVLCYIAGSINLGCFYRLGEGRAKLVGYCDSDYASDIDDSRITSGVLFFLGNNLFS
jgi:hypothetical protein